MKNSKMAVKVFFMAFFCIIMTSSSFAASNNILPMEKPIVVEKQIKVGVNESFEISMESNPSTGYMWMSPNYDSYLLNLKGSQYIPPKNNICGAPGVQKYTFKAIQTGESMIKFQYKRPWDNCIGKLVIYKVKITG